MEGQEAGGHHTAGQRAGQSQSQGEVVCEHSRGHLDCGRGPRGNELSLEEWKSPDEGGWADEEVAMVVGAVRMFQGKEPAYEKYGDSCHFCTQQPAHRGSGLYLLDRWMIKFKGLPCSLSCSAFDVGGAGAVRELGWSREPRVLPEHSSLWSGKGSAKHLPKTSGTHRGMDHILGIATLNSRVLSRVKDENLECKFF